MAKEDFTIIRNSITMVQVCDFYGLKINSKGFTRCPFHGNGGERTPSLKIYKGYRGFHCKGCGEGGDVTKFVEKYEGVSPIQAVSLLSERFNIPITDSEEISDEVLNRAKQIQLKRARQEHRQYKINAELSAVCTRIDLCKKAISMTAPFSKAWCYYQNELPKLIGKWENLFQELEK